MNTRALIKYLKSPKLILYRIIVSHPNWIKDDKKFLELKYEMCFGKKLNLEKPTTYNEKLQWLKLNYRKDILTRMVDKVSSKVFVSEKIGPEYIIPTRGVWSEVEDIDWDNLPNSFVLKTNHDSGGIVICKDKRSFNIQNAKLKLQYAIEHDNYSITREWPYKNVEKKILCEDYMEDESGQLKDYKFFCFNGEPKLMFIASDRENKTEETKFDYYDMDFNYLRIRQTHPNSTTPPKKPACFEEMKTIARKLSQGLPHARIDLYQVNGHVFFGEITLFHYGGFTPFYPDKWDNVLGDWLLLPLSSK